MDRRTLFGRLLAFAAAGATMSIPALASTSPEDRIKRHLKAIEGALAEMHPGVQVRAFVHHSVPIDAGEDRTVQMTVHARRPVPT